MRLALLSDTHGQHSTVTVPAADVVIHCGDASVNGDESATRDFLEWFSVLPGRKIFVPGNHDRVLFENPVIADDYPGVAVLIDSGLRISDRLFWGSPWVRVPERFWPYPFSEHSEDLLAEKFGAAPQDTDVLITHSPALGVLDSTDLPLADFAGVAHGIGMGSVALRRVVDSVRLRIHAHGHAHDQYGVHVGEESVVANCALMDADYRLSRELIVCDFVGNEVKFEDCGRILA